MYIIGPWEVEGNFNWRFVFPLFTCQLRQVCTVSKKVSVVPVPRGAGPRAEAVSLLTLLQLRLLYSQPVHRCWNPICHHGEWPQLSHAATVSTTPPCPPCPLLLPLLPPLPSSALLPPQPSGPHCYM